MAELRKDPGFKSPAGNLQCAVCKLPFLQSEPVLSHHLKGVIFFLLFSLLDFLALTGIKSAGEKLACFCAPLACDFQCDVWIDSDGESFFFASEPVIHSPVSS